MADRARNSRNFRTRRRVEKFGYDPMEKLGDDRHLWALNAAPDISHLSDLDLAYFSGIVDGEGYFSSMSKIAASNYEIGVGTTSIELLTWMQLKFPFGATQVRKLVLNKAGTGYNKQPYDFRIRGALAVIVVLRAIQPYLTVKAEKCQMVLDHLVPNYGKYLDMANLPKERTSLKKILSRPLEIPQ